LTAKYVNTQISWPTATTLCQGC